MKILVLSDSHGNLADMVDLIERTNPDRVFHLGDHISDAKELLYAYPNLVLDCVPGNCDWSSRTALEQIITLEGVRMLLCHGHTYGVKSGLMPLVFGAREQKATVALFGHTHKAHCSTRMGVLLCNPGSCGMGMTPTYGILTLKNGTSTFKTYPVYEEDSFPCF